MIVPDLRIHSVAARANHRTEVRRAWQVLVLRKKAWAAMPWAKRDETIAEGKARGGRRRRDELRDASSDFNLAAKLGVEAPDASGPFRGYA